MNRDSGNGEVAEALPGNPATDGLEFLRASPGRNEMLRTQRRHGFTLIDMVVTMTVLTILMAAAVPALVDVTQSMRLGQAQRDVEVEMNSARLAAVSSNRPMRIRFNCPDTGQYRVVELIGTTSHPDANDSAADRCSDTKWKYPANDNEPVTRPNHDGPVRTLPSTVTFSAVTTLEFWPDGTVHAQVGAENPWTQLDSTTGATIKVRKGTSEKLISVNGLGKIQLVQ
jgi:prepilin-type N-terminal cleavage/methylation domain-containing protein